MMKCDKCGTDKFLLLTRQNPKGETGIFHCEKCTGPPVNNTGEALAAAIKRTNDLEPKKGYI